MSIDIYDQSPTDSSRGGAIDHRPYVGIHFECCGVYARIYRDPGAMRYAGRCPKCLRELTLRVGPGGTSSRIFRAR